MRREKVKEPVTGNREKAFREAHRPAETQHGRPSRAHGAGDGDSEKKAGRTAPKRGRAPR
jgi:hypothetical protein